MRPATPAAMVAAEATLRGTLANIERDHDVHCHLHGGFNRPPKPMGPAAARLFALVRDCGNTLGLDIAWKATGGVRSEEHTSELQSLMRISYAVFCLKKKKQHKNN